MGYGTALADRVWRTNPSLVIRGLHVADTLRVKPKALERLRYQSEFYSKERPFRCWWLRNPLPGNAGDLLTPLLLKNLFDVSPIYSAAPVFMGAGSTLKRARANTVVWGSGLIKPDINVPLGAKFLAVRGPQTRGVLLEQGHRVPEIYGDPAILLPLVYNPTDLKITWRKGFIPHFLHQNISGHDLKETRLINILRGSQEKIMTLIDEVKKSQIILSSSLHGVIFAIAYEKPVIWLRFPEMPTLGDQFKFRDFFQSIGIENARPVDITTIETLNELGIQDAIVAKIPESMRARLIDSFTKFYSKQNNSAAL